MNTSQFQILSRVFTRKVILDLIRNGTNDLYHSAVKRLLQKNQVLKETNFDIIRELYLINQKFYRNEYFYKNTILNKILLGRHSINTTIALNEVPIDKSVADFVLINGRAILYEIKSEIDNTERLDSQIENYYKAFDMIFIVTHEKNEQRLINNYNNENVGLIVLNNRNQLSIRREAKSDTTKLEKEAIFKLLRKHEYENIIFRIYNTLPVANDIMYYRECFNWISKIDTEELYQMAINELHQRNISFGDDYQRTVPYELRFPLYFANMRGEDYLRLDSFLNTSYGG